jgi:hypothetical protein
MPKPTGTRKADERTAETRRAEFKAAIALARTTVEKWCADNDVTPGHLYQVLREVRESPPLIAKVDAFIDRHVATAA